MSKNTKKLFLLKTNQKKQNEKIPGDRSCSHDDRVYSPGTVEG